MGILRLLRALFHPQSIKTRVTLFVMFSLFIFFWAFSFYSTTLLRHDMQQMLQAQQFSTARIVAEQINQEINIRLNALHNVSAIAAEAMGKGPDAMQAFLNERASIQSLFNTALFVVDTHGIAIASTPTSLGITHTNYFDRDYVHVALGGKRVVGKVVMGRRLKQPTISFASPILNAHKEVIGALVGTIALGDSNFDRVAHNGYGKTGNYFIISPEHRLVITSSDKTRIMSELPLKGNIVELERFLNGYDGSAIYTNESGNEVLASSTQIPSADWRIVIESPTQEVFSPIQSMQKHIVTATLILTLVLSAFFWWLMRRQLSPIFDAIKSLEAMTMQANPHPLNVLRHDEIGQLLGSFNALLKTIHKQQIQLEAIAYYDALTNLPNRTLLIQKLQTKIAHAETFAVVLLDLDGFKMINDCYGHRIGDALLVAIAEKIQECLPPRDTLSRLGGDEFIVILNDVHHLDAMITSLLHAIALPLHIEGVDLCISASIGVSSFPQHDTVEADQLLRQADQAMYQAKLSGKHCYRLFDIEHDHDMRSYHETIEHIRNALKEEELVLYYQPKVNMRTGALLGVEALIRWQHPSKGLLAPAAFLPFVEEHPLGIEIGKKFKTMEALWWNDK